MVTGFCGNCGAPLGAQAGFCASCGASARTAAPPYPNPAVMPPPPPTAASGGSGLKIVLIVVAALFVLGVISVAGMYYAAHRFIKVAEEVTGVKADDVVRSVRESADRGDHPRETRKRDGCLLLSKAEASAILGLEVVRVDGTLNEHSSEEHCDFFVKPGSIEENEDRLKKSVDAMGNAPATDPNKLPPGAADMIKNLARGTEEATRNGDAPYFGYTVEREDGKLTLTAFRIADKLGYGDLSSTSGKAAEPLGVGDQAALGLAESRMCVVKGNAAITLDLTQVTGGRAKGIALAKLMLPRL
jgi:hypothetical protein